jgi:putative endonuclease
VAKRQFLGRWGESETARYLTEKGIEIIAQNVRTPYGEVDLIGRQGVELIFIEVKTRTTGLYGPPENAITRKKILHMVDSARYYLQEHPEYEDHWRIDVAAVVKTSDGDIQIEYFENAIPDQPA